MRSTGPTPRVADTSCGMASVRGRRSPFLHGDGDTSPIPPFAWRRASRVWCERFRVVDLRRELRARAAADREPDRRHCCRRAGARAARPVDPDCAVTGHRRRGGGTAAEAAGPHQRRRGRPRQRRGGRRGTVDVRGGRLRLSDGRRAPSVRASRAGAIIAGLARRRRRSVPAGRDACRPAAAGGTEPQSASGRASRSGLALDLGVAPARAVLPGAVVRVGDQQLEAPLAGRGPRRSPWRATVPVTFMLSNSISPSAITWKRTLPWPLVASSTPTFAENRLHLPPRR